MRIRLFHNCLIVAELEFHGDHLTLVDTRGSGELIGDNDCVELDPWAKLVGEIRSGLSTDWRRHA